MTISLPKKRTRCGMFIQTFMEIIDGKTLFLGETAKQLSTVTMGICAILIMVLMVVSANRAQEKRTKLASIQDTTPTLEPMNAKASVSSSKKVSFSFEITLSNNVDLSGALFKLRIVNQCQC